MQERICPYCEKHFHPSRFHPEQRVCSADRCQQRRRADYHRKRLFEDPAYRDDCGRSRAKWNERNPNYSKQRRAKLRVSKQEAVENPLIGELQQLLKLLRKNSAKKDSALLASRCSADVWLIERGGPDVIKKSTARVQVILLCGVPVASAPLPKR
jgi:hypothetical protein